MREGALSCMLEKENPTTNKIVLFPKCPRPFFCQKPLKIASSVAFTQKKRKIYFLEYNHRILYFTCLKSCGKNFMKFDHTDWKIIAFKVGNICFFFVGLQFQITLTAIFGIFLHYTL